MYEINMDHLAKKKKKIKKQELQQRHRDENLKDGIIALHYFHRNVIIHSKKLQMHSAQSPFTFTLLSFQFHFWFLFLFFFLSFSVEFSIPKSVMNSDLHQILTLRLSEYKNKFDLVSRIRKSSFKYKCYILNSRLLQAGLHTK